MSFKNEMVGIVGQFIKRNIPLLKYPTDTLSLTQMAARPKAVAAEAKVTLEKPVVAPTPTKVRRKRTLATLAKEEIL